MDYAGIPPSVWGPHLWRALHFVALGYPVVADTITAATYREFYTRFASVIPCSKCSNNYRRHLLELPIDRFLSGRDKLFEWTVRLHNIVNAELGHRSDWTPETAYDALLASSSKSPLEPSGISGTLIIIIALWLAVVALVLISFRRARV